MAEQELISVDFLGGKVDHIQDAKINNEIYLQSQKGLKLYENKNMLCTCDKKWIRKIRDM